jgi:hypothetical protein
LGLQQLGRFLIIAALVLAIAGALLWVFGRIGVGTQLGKLPGDLRLQGENWSCVVPITTSILLSVLLTLILSLLARFFGK